MVQYNGIRTPPLPNVKVDSVTVNIPLTDSSIEFTDFYKEHVRQNSTIFPTTGMGVYTTSTSSTMNITRGEKSMNIRTGTVRVKAGYLAQIFNGSNIVWESKKAYKTADKANRTAEKRINNKIDNLFNK